MSNFRRDELNVLADELARGDRSQRLASHSERAR